MPKVLQLQKSEEGGTVLIYTPGLMIAAQQDAVKEAAKGWNVINIGDSSPPPKNMQRPLVLVGYSAGGHRVTQYAKQLQAEAIFYCDATHIRPAQVGGQAMPEAPLREIIEAAMKKPNEGPIVFVSHTYLVYTDNIRDNPATAVVERPFMSTATTMRKLTGMPLEEPGRGNIALHSAGRLTIFSYESGDADRDAHIRQLTQVLPYLLGKLLIRVAEEEAGLFTHEHEAGADIAPPEVLPEHMGTLSFGEVYAGSDEAWSRETRRARLLIWAGAEIQNGVREEPNNSNDGPRIREYRSIEYHRRNDRDQEEVLPAGKGWEWCSMALCYGLHETRIPGDEPFTNRVSGLELEADAKRLGTIRDPKLPGRPGDLAIWLRGRPGDWKRHVTMIIADDGETMRTVGGNENNGWSPLEGVEHKDRPSSIIAVD